MRSSRSASSPRRRGCDAGLGSPAIGSAGSTGSACLRRSPADGGGAVSTPGVVRSALGTALGTGVGNAGVGSFASERVSRGGATRSIDGAAIVCEAPSSGRQRVKMLPSPGIERHSRSPPRSRASRREIASPSPLPPCRRVLVESACVNGSKRRSSCSARMPMPVSATWMQRDRPPAPSRSRKVSTMPPSSVNLIALPTRLTRICRTRIASVRSRRGTPDSARTSMASPLAFARTRMRSTTSRTSSGSGVSAISIGSFPELIRSMSRMSLMIASRWSPLRRIVRTCSSREPGSRFSSSRRSA